MAAAGPPTAAGPMSLTLDLWKIIPEKLCDCHRYVAAGKLRSVAKPACCMHIRHCDCAPAAADKVSLQTLPFPSVVQPLA